MKASLNSLSKDQVNTLACKLGEIQRHLAEDTELLSDLSELGIDLSSEIDGYDCVVEALFELQQFANQHLS
ncbi:hypothetical protein [Vibrio cholerae]|uniref:hypothetical protein n=1 Tax=Vibrio cholerae TaxID=666 RepID=UPI0009FFE3FC|nr:hypothetical protein [Vibrio cholerae]EGQ8541906.1 hypothetical protein [Vibrio parahaemolyticus]CAJ0563684.1 hypothetical protein DJICPGNB_19560 [Proteus mirabilis]EKG0025504.1 hypothetical protein [Vibrio cholerae]MBY4643436.1 hypothetical protein [Vibrio cholerae]MCR9658642.1 hypothetical protein [Vibrio cholerae]